MLVPCTLFAVSPGPSTRTMRDISLECGDGRRFACKDDAVTLKLAMAVVQNAERTNSCHPTLVYMLMKENAKPIL